jgi:uncharacterized phage-associated protein
LFYIGVVMTRIADQSESGVSFNKDIFLEAVHHIIAARTERPETLGKTKLHKCLYYADMLHFVDKGAPITGVDYIKESYGPVARYLNWALDELKRTGTIEYEKTRYFGMEKFDFVAKRPSVSNILGPYERDLLNEVIEFVCGFSAKEISEISHAQPWKSVGMGERIPYASAFLLLPQKRPSQSEIDWASEQIGKLRYRTG